MASTIGGFRLHEFKTLPGRLIEVRRQLTRAARLRDDELVGMFNLDAGYRVNFTRADPAPLLCPADVTLVVFGALAAIVMSAFTGPAIFLLAGPLLAL